MTRMDHHNGAQLRINVHVAGDNSTSLSLDRLSFHATSSARSVAESDLDRAMTFSMVTPFNHIPLVAVP
jgi:hypothetical protein